MNTSLREKTTRGGKKQRKLLSKRLRINALPQGKHVNASLSELDAVEKHGGCHFQRSQAEQSAAPERAVIAELQHPTLPTVPSLSPQAHQK